MKIRKGSWRDLDAIAALYEELNNYLECHTNYPGWKKGVYPIREDAIQGVSEQSLFVMLKSERVIGTFILNHHSEDGYKTADWNSNFDDRDVFIVHTLAVHPDFLHQGIGKRLLEFAVDYSVHMKMKARRLDVYEKNIPAIRLYERTGFEYIDTVDLGYSMYGLDLYQLYQRLL